MLLLDAGEAVIEWKFERVGGPNYRSRFRGSAPSLKVSLKIDTPHLSRMWV